jgi:hypothetical protein
MKKCVLILLIFGNSFAQEKNNVKTSFSGFLEAYYAFDFNQSTAEVKLPFMYNYNRHNEFNINIGMIKAQLEYENTYANIALQAGTYVDDNYANEKIKYLNEAFVGLYLDKTKKNSIEAGILPSYIGFESATTAANLSLTRSILAENSPYFMTGIKYNYKPSDKWNFAVLVTNGWQRINKPDKKVAPAFGTQIVYKSSANSTLNWSTFVGKEYFGTELAIRYFSNLYYDKKWNDKWRTVAGFDFGLQDTSTKNDVHKSWLSPILISQYSINNKWQTAFRAEFYQDKENIIISVDDEFETLGLSLNFDYLPNSKVKFRTEARYFDSKEKIFVKEDELINSNFFITTSLSFEF